MSSSNAVSSMLSLQVGPRANFIGSYLWQIRDQDSSVRASTARQQRYYVVHPLEEEAFPKSVVVDFDFAPSSRAESEREEVQTWAGRSSVVHRARPADKQSVFISKIRNIEFHPKTEVKAPSYHHKSWYYGSLSATEMADLEEETMDRLRHFAETCDSVEAVDVVFDLDADLGLFCEKILEEIRVDFGTSVSIPLWMVESSPTRGAASLLAPEKSLVMQSLTNPLALARFTEFADMVIPLSAQAVQASYTAHDVQVPFGIEALMSFRTAAQPISTHEFVDGCTHHGTFPVCGFESACFGSDERLPDIDSFFENNTERDRFSAPLNPMMARRSPMPLTQERNSAFTNFAVFRGWTDPDLQRKLYDHARRGDYYMTHCLSFPSPLFGQLIRAEDFERFNYSVAVASAVYSDSSIGLYLENLQQTWKENSERVKDQLAKSSIENDELRTVSERLLELSEKYTNV